MGFLFSFMFFEITFLTVGIDPALSFGFALAAACLMWFPVRRLKSTEYAMSQFTTLITGAGVYTTGTLSYVPAFIVIGDMFTDLPIDQMTFQIGGDTIQEIQVQAVIQAVAKYLSQGSLGANVKVGMVIKVATGFIPDKTFKYSFRNVGATTPAIYGYSMNRGGKGIRVGQDSINQLSNTVYTGFTALFFQDTNFDSAEVTWANGHSESKMTIVELASILNMQMTTDASGKLAAVNCIDNKKQDIKSIKLYAGAGGALAVTWLRA